MGKYLNSVPHLFINGAYRGGVLVVFKDGQWHPVYPNVFTSLELTSSILGEAKLGSLILQ